MLAALADNDAEVRDLIELDGATNARLLGEEGLLPGIGVHELLYGVAYSEIVNAAFTHAAPRGGRFNSNLRGAWYAGLERETSIAEVAFHKLEQLREVAFAGSVMPQKSTDFYPKLLSGLTIYALE